MAKKGPDISAWQGDIDINRISSQVDLLIFRGYAGTSKDKKIDRNVNLAIANNKPYGLYVYSYALSVVQAIMEANKLVELANTYSVKPNYLAIDMEDADNYKKRNGMPSNATLVAMCKAECEVFKNAGYTPVVYANSSWFKNQLAGLSGYEKWVAHWPTRGGKQTGNDTSPDGENASRCAIWQFTAEGTLVGYNGKLDMNYAYKDFVVKTATKSTTKKSNDEIAQEVIAGKWGNNEDRKNRLTKAGYDYSTIQSLVNKKLTTKTGTTTTINSYFNYTVKKGDYLSKIGKDLNIDWTKIASINGIVKPYVIYIGQVLKVPKTITVTATANIYFKKFTGNTTSIRDALNSIGEKSSYEYRTKIAEKNGIKNYSGTAAQNTQMLKLLKEGTLLKP